MSDKISIELNTLLPILAKLNGSANVECNELGKKLSSEIMVALDPSTSRRIKYYRGWNVEFNSNTGKLDSPLLCLFNYNSVVELERAMDVAIARRG